MSSNGESADLVAANEQFPADRYNVLLPRVWMSSMPDGFRLSVREIRLSDGPPDWYRVDGGKLALHWDAIKRIGEAAGVKIMRVERKDDRSHPHVCEYEAMARVVDLDGTARESIGTKAVDLRETKMTGKQLEMALRFLAEATATRATSRAIRSLIGLRSSYSQKEACKPFIIARLAADTTDPEAKKMLLGSLLGVTQALYPQASSGDADAAPQPERIAAAEIPAALPPATIPPEINDLLNEHEVVEPQVLLSRPVEQDDETKTYLRETKRVLVSAGGDKYAWESIKCVNGLAMYDDETLGQEEIRLLRRDVDAYVREKGNKSNG